jgi:hypothetical protein
MLHLAGGDDLVLDADRDVDRDREGQALVAAGLAELPGLTATSVWMNCTPLVSMLRPFALTTPAVTLLSRP